MSQEVVVDFHGFATGGEAVGRDTSGRAVFVPRVAPGERALVRLTEESPRFARGHLLELISSSSERVVAPCPYFAQSSQPSCGGCDWQHISYQAQLSAKRDIVVQALARIGKVADSEELVADCIPTPEPWHYRNKADYVIGVSGDAESQFTIGFNARESHEVVDIEHCLIQHPVNNAILSAVRDALAQGIVTPFDDRDGIGILKRLVARTSTSGECLVVASVGSEEWDGEMEFAAFLRARVPSIVGVLIRRDRERNRLVDLPDSRGWLEEEIDGLKLRVSGDGFFQVNGSLAPQLLRTALEFAEIRPGTRAIDLYCGVGFFALGMARQGAEVYGIEWSKTAIDDAEGNARLNNLTARFRSGDAAKLLAQVKSRADVVLLDPPRAGAAAAVPVLLKMKPRRIVYVSCDPATLARDVNLLQKGGYAVRRATPIDLFPQTAHVETVLQMDLTG